MTPAGGGASPCDFVLRGAGELVTMAPGVVPGAEGELGVLRHAALAARDGRIVWVGPERDLAAAAIAADAIEVDAGGACVTPGFVDPHTHAVFAGSRAAEFEARLAGMTYSEILASGGGINSTVRATRAASLEELEALTARRLDTFLLHGTTTLEVKSGYGLTTEDELKMLRAARVQHPMRRAYTHLGAHFVPPEYEGRPDEYINLVCAEMLPAAEGMAEFVDVFCDEGAFTVDQSRRVLQAGEALGMRAKLHADELALSGGSELAAELGCVSADHLIHIGAAQISALRDAGVVAVMLPGTSFSLSAKYAPARELLAAGAMVALATDFNPGTCYCENMQMAIALACQGMKLTPSQALRAATLGGAAALGRTDQVGSLEAGKWCDLLVLDGEGHHELGYHFGVNIVREAIVGGRVVVSRGRCEAVSGARCPAPSGDCPSDAATEVSRPWH
jgi:imidazolonepropionase